jgi:hypothetical protein
LEGYENALGLEHTLTLNTVNNLGLLYNDQGKQAEAEGMYQRALKGYKNALGSDYAKCNVIRQNIKSLTSLSSIGKDLLSAINYYIL